MGSQHGSKVGSTLLDTIQEFRGIDKLDVLLTAINIDFDHFVVSLCALSEKCLLGKGE